MVVGVCRRVQARPDGETVVSDDGGTRVCACVCCAVRVRPESDTAVLMFDAYVAWRWCRRDKTDKRAVGVVRRHSWPHKRVG